MVIKLNNGQTLMINDPEHLINAHASLITAYSNLGRPLTTDERNELDYMLEVHDKILAKMEEEKEVIEESHSIGGK